ncbi:MAG: ferrous iron transport protein B [Eggerthellaceae bacterium]|nr:ferrous iron transport protein B [Eggerthellaceae bacterium]
MQPQALEADKNAITLKDLAIGESATVTAVGGEGSLRQHFLDMGIIPGTKITLVKYAPMGDPMEFQVRGYQLTLRMADAAKIAVKRCEGKADESAGMPRTASSPSATPHQAEALGTGRNASPKESPQSERGGLFASKRAETEHPGLGEGGRFHNKEDEQPLPPGTTLTFALAGNQNCGKTTLFNQLTGANQHVGNFPGVTVDRKSGIVKGHDNAQITDLPGIYSLSPYSSEEIVTRQFLLEEQPTGIVNIVDATNIERNLYLTMQLMELDIPMVLALNMLDEVRNSGGSVDINKMEELLGIPVVPIAASKNEGVDELVRHAIHVAQYQERPSRADFCDASDHGGAVHRCLHGIMHLIEDHARDAGIPKRFAATKVVEGDSRVLEALQLTQNELEMTEHIIRQMEEERGCDRAAAIADMRFSFIQKLVDATVAKPRESAERTRSRALDRVLTGKYTAIPAFVAIMAVVFWLTFSVVGAWLQELLETGIGVATEAVDAAMTSWQVNDAIHSLVIDGIFNGVGTVLSFLPIIIVLFFFLSLLEDTGYMARVAFVMDKLLRKIGLSGRSIVPMLIGFGCTVPGVMASRTLPSERDRTMTILLTPFMSCSAKLPIYAFLTAAFFPEHAGLVMVALAFKGTLFKGEPVPFVMELPNYRMPGLKNVMQLLWEKSKDFLQRAFTIIFLATIVIWFLQTFDLRLNMVTDSQDSILALVAGVVAPLFAPLGLGDWRIVTALISGFMAKESVVSTLTILFGSMEGLLVALTPLAALALLVFCLLYTPCVAAVASIKRELGGKWAFAVVLGQCAIAWACALIVRLIGLALGMV